MMFGHDANPIFFNKKNKDWTSRALAIPQPPTSDSISFCLTLPHPQSGRHMFIAPRVEKMSWKIVN